MQRYTPTYLLCSCALLAIGATAAHAKVTKAVLNATPADYRGGCPAVITFTGTVTTNGPGKVKYIFTRSDGAIDTITKTLVFKKAGTQNVSTTWTLGGTPLPYYKGWEATKILGAVPFTSNEAGFEIRCNPPLSAIAAHGNTDWHLQTANEFLFGTDMNGQVQAANHAPDNWTKRHIHVGLTNTSKFYYDKTLTSTGSDIDPVDGIDTTMLFFYAGHGNPNLWCSLGDTASQPDVKLANVMQGGILRYYWQCSCEVFAHGPQCSDGGGGTDYNCPQNFTGGADSASMQRVPTMGTGADARSSHGMPVFRRWLTVTKTTSTASGRIFTAERM